MKLTRAVEEVKTLLVPLTEAEDELKKRQLMELAIINGTYRDNSVANARTPNQFAQAAAAAQYYIDPARLSLALAAGQFRQQTLGSPLILPSRNNMSSAGGSPHYYSQNPMADAAAGLMYAPYDYSLAASLLNGDYQLDHHHHLGSVGGFLPR
jgi:protein quaking